MISRRAFIAALGACVSWPRCADAAFASFMAAAPAAPSGGTNFYPLAIGGGGYVIGQDTHPAAQMFAMNVDVFGGYTRVATPAVANVQVFTSASLPSSYQNCPYIAGGFYAIAFDPNDATGNTLYALQSPLQFTSLCNLLVTTNGGQTWATTTFPQISASSNDSYRIKGPCIRVDPVNPDIIYVGTPSHLYVTITGPQGTWSSVSGVTAATTAAGVTGIRFDPTSGTASVTGAGGTGIGTNRVLVGSNGNGVYAGTISGGTISFALISGSPTSIGHGYMASDGNYYCTVAENAGGNLTRISTGNAVTAISSSRVVALCVDPANAANGVTFDYSAYPAFFNAAMNTGTPTLTQNFTAQTLTATGCGWLTLIGSVAFPPGDAMWDPYLGSSSTSMTIGTGTFNPNLGPGQNITVGVDILQIYASSTQWMIGKVTAYNSTTGASTISVGSYSYGGHYGAATGGSGTFSSWTISKVRLWVTTGAGLLRVDIPSGSAALGWVEETSGIENMVGYNVTWSLGGNVIVTCEDMQMFCITSQPVGATGQNGRGPVAVIGSTIEGTLADVSSTDSTYWVVSQQLTYEGSATPFQGVSTSGGTVGTTANGNTTSWAAWASTPPVKGYMACSTDLNTCIAGWGGGSIYFTTNGGSSWTQATSSPTTPSGSYWSWPGSNYLTKDWVTNNKFYFIQWNGSSTGTVMTSTNGGQTWTSGGTFSSTGYLNVIKAVPGQAGHLFVTQGARPDTGSPSTIAALVALHPISAQMYFSSNSGTTLTAVPGLKEVISMGFTAEASGQTYPGIRAIGWSSAGVYGVYGCDNFNPSSVSATTWTYLGLPKCADWPQDLSGDPNQYGRGSVTFAGSGAEVFQVSGQPNTWP